jgi:hypothetical protein
MVLCILLCVAVRRRIINSSDRVRNVRLVLQGPPKSLLLRISGF